MLKEIVSEETYCPICSRALNYLTRPHSKGLLGSFNEPWFGPKLPVKPPSKFYCETCDVELWRYSEDDKESMHTGWYIHTPVNRIAKDRLEDILHSEEDRKVFTLVYAREVALHEKCSGVASSVEAMLSQWIQPITSLSTRGYLPHHIENTAEHMIADHELTDDERYAFFNSRSEGHDEAIAKVKEEALKRACEAFGINQPSNGYSTHWKIIEFNLKTGQTKEYPRDTIHGYNDGDDE